jgi:hypothetical protein
MYFLVMDSTNAWCTSLESNHDNPLLQNTSPGILKSPVHILFANTQLLSCCRSFTPSRLLCCSPFVTVGMLNIVQNISHPFIPGLPHPKKITPELSSVSDSFNAPHRQEGEQFIISPYQLFLSLNPTFVAIHSLLRKAHL